MLKTVVGSLVVPIMYRVNPVYTGRQALRGFLIEQGVDPTGIPLAATEELAADALKLSKFTARMSRTSAMFEYTQTLQVYITQIRALLLHRDRTDPFLQDSRHIKDVMEKHGVRVPSIVPP